MVKWEGCNTPCRPQTRQVHDFGKAPTADLISRGRRQYILVRGKGAKEHLVPIPRVHPRLQKNCRAHPVSSEPTCSF